MTKAHKTLKKTRVSLNVRAIADKFTRSVVGALKGINKANKVRDAAAQSTNATLLDAAYTMRDECGKDTGAYLSARQIAFGNGLAHLAKGYDGGTVRQTLKDASIPAESVKVYMAKVRAGSDWIADPAHNAKRPATLDELYALCPKKDGTKRGTKQRSASVEAPEAEAGTKRPTETMEQAIARWGIPAVLNCISATLDTVRKTKTIATTLRAIVEQMAA